MSKKNKRPGLALGAIVVGVASLPVAATVSTTLGLVMMALPVYMIYLAS